MLALPFALLATLTGCPGGDPASPSGSGPAVIARSPEADATGVVRNTIITATFDRDLDAATIESPAAGFVAEVSGSAVPATVAYDALSRTAILTPSSALPASADVAVRIATSVTDATGDPVGSEIRWSFTTGTTSDSTPPSFGGITGANDGGDGTATLSWAAATDDVTPPAQIVYRAYLSSDLATPVASVTGAMSVVTSSFAPGTYSFVVRASDGAGNQDTNTASSSVAITVPSVSFAEVQSIFTSNCTSAPCHDSMAPAQGLDLTTGNAYGNIVNVASAQQPAILRVEPGDATNSYLYMKLTAGPGITGNQMPSGGASPLSSSDLTSIRNWILNGAPP